MKQSLQMLMDEHRIIERACRVLSNMAKSAEKKNAVASTDWETMIGFIKGFADTCHHGKEEDQLFKVLIERGMSKEEGPVAVMLSDHDAGRQFVGGMLQALKDSDIHKLVENARGYVTLLPQHIWKEDNILYQMADEALSADDEKELLKKYAEHEEKKIGKNVREKFIKSVEEMAAKYGEDNDVRCVSCCG